jgi:hypothetical protein
MKTKLSIAVLAALSFTTSSSALAAGASKLYAGIDGGYAWADIGAPATAQYLANLSGSTVTYTYDKADLFGRFFMGYDLSNEFALEAGYFFTADLNATYRISGASATEAYSARGFDFAAVYKPGDQGFFVKAGMHSSEITSNATITIGGTTYSGTGTKSGSGFLIGAGYEGKLGNDSAWRVGYTFMDSVGGLSSADAGLVSVSLLKRF